MRFSVHLRRKVSLHFLCGDLVLNSWFLGVEMNKLAVIGESIDEPRHLINVLTRDPIDFRRKKTQPKNEYLADVTFHRRMEGLGGGLGTLRLSR